MIRKIVTYIRYPVLIAVIVLCLVAVAQAVTGNIDAVDKWAWGANVGWINFAPTHGGVTVYSDHLEGYAWGENIGWIRMGSYDGGGAHTYLNTTKDNYGVNRDANGDLSDYAWGTNVGWINFSPTHGGVTIDLNTGSFDGYAWGENIGWIHFKGTAPAYNVVTSYYPTASDLSITKAVDPATANPGDTITYTITFSNTGGALASGVVITDIVPVSVTNTSVISSGVAITQIGGTRYVWDVADLAPGQGGVITITGQLSATMATGTFTNTVVITTTTVGDEPGNNSSDAGVTVMAADDGDGVPDAVEDGAPNGGDGNNDGIPDSQQGNVASLPNAVDGRYVTLVSPPGTNLADVQAVDTPADAPAGVTFPVGLFQFTVQGLAPGGATAVTLLLPAGLTVDTYYKHGPNPPGGAVQWYEFLFDAGSGTGANIGAGQVVLNFVDGQRGDDLAGLDGQVVEPGGPGQQPPQPPVPVGGIIVPVNKLGLVAPWMGLVTLAGLASLGVVLVRRRKP